MDTGDMDLRPETKNTNTYATVLIQYALSTLIVPNPCLRPMLIHAHNLQNEYVSAVEGFPKPKADTSHDWTDGFLVCVVAKGGSACQLRVGVETWRVRWPQNIHQVLYPAHRQITSLVCAMAKKVPLL